MKKIIVLALLVSFCLTINAQTDLKKKIVDSTCSCLTEMPDLSTKSKDELQAAIGQCMMQKSMSDFMALAQERNIELTDMDGMQKLGMEIGMDLVKADCKAMSSIMLKMAQNEMGNKEKTTETKEAATVKGTVQNVEIKEFVYVTILSGAKSTQLVWSDVVTNGNSYAKNLVTLKSKSLQFFYIEKEVYSTKAKAYITVKMITEIK